MMKIWIGVGMAAWGLLMVFLSVRGHYKGHYGHLIDDYEDKKDKSTGWDIL